VGEIMADTSRSLVAEMRERGTAIALTTYAKITKPYGLFPLPHSGRVCYDLGVLFDALFGSEFEAAYGERPMYPSVIVRQDTMAVSEDGYWSAVPDIVPGVERGDVEFIRRQQRELCEFLRTLDADGRIPSEGGFDVSAIVTVAAPDRTPTPSKPARQATTKQNHDPKTRPWIIGATLKRQRILRGWSIEYAAGLADIEPGHLKEIEDNGGGAKAQGPAVHVLERVANIYDLTTTLSAIDPPATQPQAAGDSS
jgi:hypothetical protein